MKIEAHLKRIVQRACALLSTLQLRRDIQIASIRGRTICGVVYWAPPLQEKVLGYNIYINLTTLAYVTIRLMKSLAGSRACNTYSNSS